MIAPVLELVPVCQVCRREVPEGALFLQHKELGIVCEFCPEFPDGGIEIGDDDD